MSSHSAPSQHPPISMALCGAGISSLSLAAALSKKHPNITYTIYEAHPSFPDIGAGLALHANALSALKLLGPELFDMYLQKASVMGGEVEQEMCTEVRLAQGEGMGTLVAELGRAKGRKTVKRSELVRGLRGLLDGDEETGRGRVLMGRRVKSVREVGEKVEVEVEGVEEKQLFDLFIGADGLRSVVRGYVCGDEMGEKYGPVNHDGWVIYRRMVDMEEAMREGVSERWKTVVPILLGPRGHINCMPLEQGTKLSAGVAVRGAMSKAIDGKSPELDPRIYNDYSDEAKAIANLVAKDTSGSWTAADHDHAPTYFRGRVALMGDAAHASLPFAGNGAAQALEDAAVLDVLLTRLTSPSQIPSLLSTYDSIRRPRSQAVVDLARKFGRIYAYAEGNMHKDPASMKAFFAEAAAFTNSFDVAKQNQDALDVFHHVISIP